MKIAGNDEKEGGGGGTIINSSGPEQESLQEGKCPQFILFAYQATDNRGSLI